MTHTPPLIRLPLSQMNRPIDVIMHWHKRGDLLLDAPYQRGEVWGETRQRNLIRSILLGIPIPSIVVNDRFGAGWKDDTSYAVIDGKQRITAVLKFFTGKLKVPRVWFRREATSVGGDDLISFLELTKVGQRIFSNILLAITEGRLPDIESEREVFELINFGGVPQGEMDI